MYVFVCVNKLFLTMYLLPQIFFGTQQAKMYIGANCLGINCTTGMSCLCRKEVAEEAGGMKYFGQFLAEDYMLAQAFLDR